MINVTATIVGDEVIVRKFERFDGRLQAELRKGISRAALMVSRQSKQNKLSGQVLQVKTGRLRRSIHYRTKYSGSMVEAAVGTNVSYARGHEFGFKGAVTVREHLRRTKAGAMAPVRTHARNVDMPARSFLRSALADMAPAVRQEFQDAVHRALA